MSACWWFGGAVVHERGFLDAIGEAQPQLAECIDLLALLEVFRMRTVSTNGLLTSLTADIVPYTAQWVKFDRLARTTSDSGR
jgi:hypothetical protein